MSPTGSVQSTGSSVKGFVMKIAQNSKPGVEIVLNNHTPQKTYTTFDPVTGVVQVTAPQNVRFDEIKITLEGRTKTFVEHFSAAGTRSRSVSRHVFLKLTMPLDDSNYPQPRIAEAGITYSFPFNFNIPEQLLPRACNHKVQSYHVQQAHLQLPPSMGDKEVSQGEDDLAPDMSKITYAVRAEVVRQGDSSHDDTVLVEGIKKIRVIPAIAEAPPLSFVDDDGEYIFTKTKALKKGLFKGTLGRITVTAAQTKALVLPPPSATCPSVISTATLNLRFYPNNKSDEPPKLGGGAAKIKASTFFSTVPSQTLPNFSSQRNAFEGPRGVYSTMVTLASRCMESVSWTRHEPAPAGLRRESNSTTCSDSSASVVAPEDDDELHYSAKIIFPIALPSTKLWVPSFTSCIISRVYALEFSLTVHTPGAGVPSSMLSLRLPVQIASAGNPEGRLYLTAAEAAEELASADEFLRPRVLETPDSRFIGNSFSRSTESGPSAPARDLPPNYNHGPQRAVSPEKC